MSLRVLLISSVQQSKRLVKLFKSLKTVVEVVGEAEWRAGNFDLQNADLVVAERTYLPSDGQQLNDAVLCLTESSPLVIISSRVDPVDRTCLLAAGCTSVLFQGSADELLRDVIKDVLRSIERRRREDAGPLEIEPIKPLQGAVIRALSPHGTAPQWRPLAEFGSFSSNMRELLANAKALAAADTTLLLLGETGVGKETIARGIHLTGPRKEMPFIAVNCGGLNENLMESELFGHERGAFTDAHQMRRGAFELADGGTLLLDEIGDMPIHLQVKLLRVLQDRCFRRVGSEQEIPVNVRIISATHRDPQLLLAEKKLRSDLFYRLAVVSITVPPLRERPEDIVQMANLFLGIFCSRMGRRVRRFSPEAIAAMLNYPWPGNVRELVNTIERAVLFNNSPEIIAADLRLSASFASETTPVGMTDSESAVTHDSWGGSPPDKPWHEARQEALASFERAYLDRLLRQTNGQLGLAAGRAGLNPRTLYNKMRQCGLSKEKYREQ